MKRVSKGMRNKETSCKLIPDDIFPFTCMHFCTIVNQLKRRFIISDLCTAGCIIIIIRVYEKSGLKV